MRRERKRERERMRERERERKEERKRETEREREREKKLTAPKCPRKRTTPDTALLDALANPPN
jgi:hypothetical protein